MAYAYYNNSGGVSYYPRYGGTSSSSTSNAARTAALAGLLGASSFIPGGAIVTYPTTVALSSLSSVNPAAGFTGSTGSSSTKSSSTGSTKSASSVYTPTKTTTPTYTSTPTSTVTGGTTTTTNSGSGTGSSSTGGASSSSSTTNTPPPAPQSILNTTITVPQGKAPSLNSTPANASGTGSSSTAGTSLPSFAKSAAGFASRESPSFVSGVPSVDQLYNIYEQTFGKPQNPEAVRKYLGSEDFQSVLGGTVPMWMSSNPTWKLYLQRLGYNTGSNNVRAQALQNYLNQ